MRHQQVRPRASLQRPAALIAALVLASCAGDNPLSTAQLEAVADSHLYFPGSQVVRAEAVAQQAAQLNAAPTDGFVTTALRTPAPGDAVVAWYQHALPRRGWSYRAREPHGDMYDGHAVPPAYLFTRGTQEVFALAIDPIAGDYIITYTALIDHCDTKPPYPLGAGDCANGKPR